MSRGARSRVHLLAVVGLGLTVLTACRSGYGADFGFPDAAPVPRGATVLSTDGGSDDDNPLRSRQQVLDLGTVTQEELVASYRAAYPASEGWHVRKAGGDQQLCLVDEGRDHTDVVEVFAWTGSRLAPAPTLRLVSVSRFEAPDPDVCGLSLAWTSPDLF